MECSLRPSRSLPVVLVAALASCRSFDVEREQVFLRYQPDEDVLDVLLAYDGVGAVSDAPKDIEGSAGELESLAGGRRKLMIWDWPLELDFDEMVEELRAEQLDDDDPAVVQAFLEYQENISLIETRFVSNESGRLSMLQALRFEHGSRFIRLVDQFVNSSLLEEEGDDTERTGDLRTDALILERARRGGSWARFDGAELEVTVPMTPERAARQLQELVAGASDPEATAEFLGALSSLTITGDELRLRFAPREDGWIRFSFVSQEREYRPDVAERLVGRVPMAVGELEAEIAKLKSEL